MNAVGIDVSKGKSTVTIRRPGNEVVMSPRDIRHTQSSINELIGIIKGLDGETKVCMEHTGRYYEPMATWLSDAGIFVSAVNPILIRQAVAILNALSATVENLRAKMNKTASQLPEYPVVMEMEGVGPTLGPQLIAEIGDVTRFVKRGALTAFAGVDPRPNESGSYKAEEFSYDQEGISKSAENTFSDYGWTD